MAGRWGTARTSTAEWKALRVRVLDRDGWSCKATVNGKPCGHHAKYCDHVIAKANGGSDHPSNLQALCKTCHEKKTAGEANAIRHQTSTRRPAEQHPGLL